jgi:hypothetical protein
MKLYVAARSSHESGPTWHKHAKTEDADKLLGSVHNRFNEGLETADLRTALPLLDQLA